MIDSCGTVHYQYSKLIGIPFPQEVVKESRLGVARRLASDCSIYPLVVPGGGGSRRGAC